MRISDWSSDVCSSDLNEHLAGATFAPNGAVGYPRILSPDRRPFRTADGWIAVLPYTERQWRAFLDEIGRADIARDPWFDDPPDRAPHIDPLYAPVAARLAPRPPGAWRATLQP